MQLVLRLVWAPSSMLRGGGGGGGNQSGIWCGRECCNNLLASAFGSARRPLTTKLNTALHTALALSLCAMLLQQHSDRHTWRRCAEPGLAQERAPTSRKLDVRGMYQIRQLAIPGDELGQRPLISGEAMAAINARVDFNAHAAQQVNLQTTIRGGRASNHASDIRKEHLDPALRAQKPVVAWACETATLRMAGKAVPSLQAPFAATRPVLW